MKYLLLNINATNKWIYLELNHFSFMIEVALIVKINFIICGTCVCSVNISFIFYFHFFFLGLLFLGLKKNKIWIKWSQRCAPGGCIHTPLTEVYSLLIQPLSKSTQFKLNAMWEKIPILLKKHLPVTLTDKLFLRIFLFMNKSLYAIIT